MVEPTVELTGKLNMPGQPIKQARNAIVPCGQVGQWLLIVGARSIRQMMMKVIAGLAEQEHVRVLDGGNYTVTGDPNSIGPGQELEWFMVAQYLRGIPHALDRIAIARAASCHQVLSVLENTPSIASPFVVLDLLNTFYDVSVKFRERKQLLRGCLENLGRLEKYAGGVVSVSPPRLRKKEAVELLKMVEEAASETYRIEIVIPSPDLNRFH